MKRKINTRQMVMLALLAALAYVVMMVGRVPVVLWLKYDPKDVILAISGFLYGPVAAFATTSVVAFVEMKQESGRLSRRQHYVCGMLRAMGCRVYVIYNKEQALDMLREVMPDEVHSP